MTLKEHSAKEPYKTFSGPQHKEESDSKFAKVTYEKRIVFERGPEGSRTEQKVFTTEPRTRRKYIKHRGVHAKAREIVDSFYPNTLISYDTIELRMNIEFDLWDRTTILAYLGRPEVRKSHRIDQEVQYRRTGTVVPKTHTFRRRLSAKKGYLEKLGLATLFINDKGKWYFKLHHQRQETLDEISPSPSPYPRMKG